jgi:hypothetical protein
VIHWISDKVYMASNKTLRYIRVVSMALTVGVVQSNEAIEQISLYILGISKIS